MNDSNHLLYLLLVFLLDCLLSLLAIFYLCAKRGSSLSYSSVRERLKPKLSANYQSCSTEPPKEKNLDFHLHISFYLTGIS